MLLTALVSQSALQAQSPGNSTASAAAAPAAPLPLPLSASAALRHPAGSSNEASRLSMVAAEACWSLLLSMLHYLLVEAEHAPKPWLLASVTHILQASLTLQHCYVSPACGQGSTECVYQHVTWSASKETSRKSCCMTCCLTNSHWPPCTMFLHKAYAGHVKCTDNMLDDQQLRQTKSKHDACGHCVFSRRHAGASWPTQSLSQTAR